MMFLDEGQRNYLRSRASWILGEIKIKEGLWKGEEVLIGWMADQLQESCGMGYSIACDEYGQSPWEYRADLPGSEMLNSLSAQGWEPLMPTGNRILLRRRKLVSEREVKDDDRRAT